MTKGWHKDRKGHHDAAVKAAKHRKPRKKGKPVVTSEKHVHWSVRDSNTGALGR